MYRKLKVWKKSHEFTLEIYKQTEKFPSSERMALTQQIRRAAYSIPMNIAEGFGTIYRKQLVNYLSIARGSSFEISYQLILARDLKYWDEETYERLNGQIVEIQKMISGLIRKMQQDNKNNLKGN
ncbi:MAG TPA: four helix bundle protein [Clostridia bacterium]|nr:four helix bundle protein [Clostridia bacterium]